MAQAKISLPVRPRRYRFALTPLADAMFQLLIFFMLTSSLTPYSLLTVQTAPAPPPQASTGVGTAAPATGTATPAASNQPAPAAPASGPAPDVIWTLEAGKIIARGQEFGYDSLDMLAAALGEDDRPHDVLIVVRGTARVQDVTTVLARLSVADVGAVSITRGAR